MWSFVDKYKSRLAHHTRCLDWDGWYGGSIFAQVCSELDVIEYGKPFGRVAPKRLRWQAQRHRAARWYLADAHSMASYLDRGSYDLIIANSVFEHLHQPFVAMGEVRSQDVTSQSRGCDVGAVAPFDEVRVGRPRHRTLVLLAAHCLRTARARACSGVQAAAAGRISLLAYPIPVRAARRARRLLPLHRRRRAGTR